jgi:hypothetical protein
LFRRPVSELNMTWREFCHWQAFLHENPPEASDDRRVAALMAQITNMSGRSLRDNKRVSAADFLGGEKEQTMQQQIDFMRTAGNG